MGFWGGVLYRSKGFINLEGLVSIHGLGVVDAVSW